MTETAQLERDAILMGRVGFAEITDRTFLRITGSDAARWLNGMVTNSVVSLDPGKGNYNFLLNAQGRIQGDCTIYRDSAALQDNYLLETSSDQVVKLREHLERFIIMDDVELNQEFTDLKGFLLFGNAIKMTQSIGSLGLPNLQLTDDAQTNIGRGYILLKRKLAESTTAYQYELWFRPENYAEYSEKLLKLDIQEASAEDMEQFRIEKAIPKFGQDIRDRDLPQETAQTHALHFAKGCYLGQEIVERIRSRGQVHRTFAQFTLTGDLPTLPATLTSGEKPVGELTSAARIGDEIVALGTIRREILDTHAAITYRGGTTTPRT